MRKELATLLGLGIAIACLVYSIQYSVIVKPPESLPLPHTFVSPSLPSPVQEYDEASDTFVEIPWEPPVVLSAGTAVLTRLYRGDIPLLRILVGRIHASGSQALWVIPENATRDEVAEASLFRGVHISSVPPLLPYTEVALGANGTAMDACDAQMVPIPVEPRPWAASRPLWCIAIATYHPSCSQESPLLTQFLPGLRETKNDSYAYALYIGTQVDPCWDDPVHRAKLLTGLRASGIPFRITRYSLNPGLRDLAEKYNAILAQAYADGCFYLYQFSDDARFLPPPGWASTLAEALDAQGGFGTAGIKDLNSPGTMTLGASGRIHMEIQGSFWPRRMKNWYADNYVQAVYGRWSRKIDSFAYRNMQTLGQRYSACIHEKLMWEEITASRYRAWKWAIRKNHTELAVEMKDLTEKALGEVRWRKGKPGTWEELTMSISDEFHVV
jgi:hypothetical protein